MDGLLVNMEVRVMPESRTVQNFRTSDTVSSGFGVDVGETPKHVEAT